MQEKFKQLSIQLNFKKLHQVLVLLFGLIIFFLVGTWLYNGTLLTSAPNPVKRLVTQLNLGTENVAASWYSSMLLFLVGVAAGLCFLADNQRLKSFWNRVLNLGWIMFSLIFITLSFDEMGSFHEVIGDSTLFKSAGEGMSGGGWYIFYLLVGAVGIFMMIFFLLKFFRNWAALGLAVLGVLLFLSNPLQENFEIESMKAAANQATWRRPIFFLLLEEGSELFGSYCLLFSFIIYLRTSVGKVGNAYGPASLSLPSRRLILIQVGLAFAALTLCMLVIRFYLPVPKISGSGSADNWFPSITSFFCFIFVCYLLSAFKMSRPLFRTMVLAAAFTGFMSLFFGANLYDFDDVFFVYFKVALLIGIIVSGVLFSIRFKNKFSQIIALAATALGVASLFATNYAISFLEYFLFCFFTYSILSDFSDRGGSKVKI